MTDAHNLAAGLNRFLNTHTTPITAAGNIKAARRYAFKLRVRAKVRNSNNKAE